MTQTQKPDPPPVVVGDLVTIDTIPGFYRVVRTPREEDSEDRRHYVLYGGRLQRGGVLKVLTRCVTPDRVTRVDPKKNRGKYLKAAKVMEVMDTVDRRPRLRGRGGR